MKTERPTRPEKLGRSDRGKKPERPIKPEKSGRSERVEKPGRPIKPERPGRSERVEKSERPFKPERAGRSERVEKPERPIRPERAGRSKRLEKPDRPHRPVKISKPEQNIEPKRSVRSGNKIKIERSGKQEDTARPERTSKSPKVIRRGKKNEDPDLMRLNKYIANSGISSRREADKLIEAGAVSVNGIIVTELGTKVGPGDKVQYGDQTINREKPRYVLLNKPKGYITTVDDPEKRKTVMVLVAGACKERIYPVGRLDRNTTGLLLFTNDGNIAKKLTHPRYGIKKIYHVELDKNLARADFLKITEGFKLDDETVSVDAIEYIGDGKDKKQIGIELHSGQNRIVRRIFEFFDYKVLRLDRVYYAGLTKKNLPRGNWRLLDEQEINLLKMISSKP